MVSESSPQLRWFAGYCDRERHLQPIVAYHIGFGGVFQRCISICLQEQLVLDFSISKFVQFSVVLITLGLDSPVFALSTPDIKDAKDATSTGRKEVLACPC